ncbi:MAG: RIP metalloprotease RseP [Candidatus Omnitrophota bacterium]
MIEWIAVFLAFSFMILIHELGHFLTALKVGAKVDIFSIGMGPKLFSITRNNVEYRLSAVPLGGYVKIAGEDPSEPKTGEKWEFSSQSVGNRFKIIFAGSALNYILGFTLFSFVFFFGYPTLTATVGGLMDNYPAKEAGVKAQDTIIAIDNEAVDNWEDVTGKIRGKIKGPIILTVDRSGSRMKIEVKPLIKETKDILGKEVKIALVGITPSDKVAYARYGLFKSFKMGAEKITSITALTYQGLWGLITGRLPFKESVSGPVGIFNVMASAAKMGIMPLLYLTAYISALLAIFNLLPFPPLDGGIILFLLIEKIMGKPVSRKAQEAAMQTGWIILIGLMLFVTYNDIFKLVKK